MRFLSKRIFISLLTLFLINSVSADSPVWKISKGDEQLYLGGTIHVLGAQHYPLPVAFDTAYKQSAMLVFEANIDQLQSPKAQQLLMKAVMLEDGKTLNQLLKPETMKQLEAFANKRKIPIRAMMKFKPGMLIMTLTITELQRIGINGQGVDSLFDQKAMKDRKQRIGLETTEEHIRYLSELGLSDPDDIIRYTLRDLDQLPKMFEEMVEVWEKGDRQGIKKLINDPLKADFPKVYELLLTGRNKAWMPKIENMFKTNEIEMVLVGMAHLVGEDGLLLQLKKKGYKIEQLK